MIKSDTGKSFEDYRNNIRYLKQKLKLACQEKEKLKNEI